MGKFEIRNRIEISIAALFLFGYGAHVGTFNLISAVVVDVVAYHIELIRFEGVEGFIDKVIKSKHLIGLTINRKVFRTVKSFLKKIFVIAFGAIGISISRVSDE